MGQQMPSLVKCNQCARTFPVRAQMQVQGTALPMLVVLSQVDSVEAALEQATCQVCLGKTGPIDRGLYEILKALGLQSEEASRSREVMVVVATADRPVRNSAVVISSRPREVAMFDPLMGTSIEVHTPPVHDRLRGPRRDNQRPVQSEPRVPRALREPERRERPIRVQHLSTTLGRSGDNAAVLEQATVGIRQRDEARRLERAKKFEKLMFYLLLSLGRIRKNATKVEVWDLVDIFERKLGEAVSLDSQQRGKKGLLTALGTSAEELESLCVSVYLGTTRLLVRSPREFVTIDAYEGSRRPESWDMRGGRRPAFHQFEVVRTKNLLPVPNPPLPDGDEDPRPRIVYPQDGQYGPDYKVKYSRRDPKIDQICQGVFTEFLCWLGQYHEQLGITTEPAKLTDNIVELVEVFFTYQKQECDAQVSVEDTTPAVEPNDSTTLPELPVTI